MRIIRFPERSSTGDSPVGARHAFIGFLFVLQGVLLASNLDSAHTLAWYCNHLPILFALAFLFNRMQVVKGLLSAGIVAQVAWTLDLVSMLFFEFPLFGVTGYVFEGLTLGTVLSVLVHTVVPAAALLLSWNVVPRTFSLIVAAVYSAVLWGVSVAFVDPAHNVNCVWETCVFPGLIPSEIYPYLWPLLMALFVILPGHLLQVALARGARKSTT